MNNKEKVKKEYIKDLERLTYELNNFMYTFELKNSSWGIKYDKKKVEKLKETFSATQELMNKMFKIVHSLD